MELEKLQKILSKEFPDYNIKCTERLKVPCIIMSKSKVAIVTIEPTPNSTFPRDELFVCTRRATKYGGYAELPTGWTKSSEITTRLHRKLDDLTVVEKTETHPKKIIVCPTYYEFINGCSTIKYVSGYRYIQTILHITHVDNISIVRIDDNGMIDHSGTERPGTAVWFLVHCYVMRDAFFEPGASIRFIYNGIDKYAPVPCKRVVKEFKTTYCKAGTLNTVDKQIIDAAIALHLKNLMG